MKRSHQPAPFKYISINARNIEKYIAAIFMTSFLLIINFQQCDQAFLIKAIQNKSNDLSTKPIN